ncbi:MAG: VWA domain-containing protein, partial [Desertifilum sp. SIO1I2]|nr:VWA domain-containing protein [Desertifilum sp. SIO1I2]
QVDRFERVGNFPTVYKSFKGEYEYQIFVDPHLQKIVGSAQELEIPATDCWIYKYQRISAEEYRAIAPTSTPAIFAFAYAHLNQGNFNQGKAALWGTGDSILLQKYAKSLTKSDLHDLLQALKETIFHPEILKNRLVIYPKVTPTETSVIELLELLEAHKDSIILNLQELRSHYCRTGIKQVVGTRDPQGKLVQPHLKTQPIYQNQYVPMGRFNFSRHSATVNLQIAQSVHLLNPENDAPISEIAGILPQQLKTYQSYTLIRDGELNIKSLRLKFSNYKVFQEIQATGVLHKISQSSKDFDFRAEYEIQLQYLPLVPDSISITDLGETFSKVAELQILLGIISATLKGHSAVYLTEQIAELQEHYLSPNLYFNFPKTSEFINLETALEDRKVASRNRYEIELGNLEILSLGKLYSANTFLKRFYEQVVSSTGEIIEKPSCDRFLQPDIIFRHKKLSSRLKITSVDTLMQPFFDSFFGLAHPGKVVVLLHSVGAIDLAEILQAKWQGESIIPEQFVEALTSAKAQIHHQIEQLYQERIAPLILYVGATGFLPDSRVAIAQTAEQLATEFPDLNLTQRDRTGLFFNLGDCLIGIYPKTTYYSL